MAVFLEWAVGPYTVRELLLSFIFVLAGFGFRGLFTNVILRGARLFTSKTNSDYDDRLLTALEKPLANFMPVFGIYLAIAVLPLSDEWSNISSLLFRGVSMVLFFWGLIRVVDVLIDVAMTVTGAGDKGLAGFAPLVKKSLRIFLCVLGTVMVVDNLGYDIGGILATLGIGGAALAFASKDTIANLYGSIALALDRPFRVGDWIQVGSEVDGDVESIGLRSTKVRTWPKTVISIPNSVLANAMINNWSRMPKRRVKQVIGVTYDTSPETMNQLVDDIRQLLREDEGVQQDFILVNWTDFGASSLDILVYYFTTTIAWVEHMNVRQRINTKIAQAVTKRGSSVAFPTRTLHLAGDEWQRLNQGQPLPGDGGPQFPN
ncbi:MAG: mechanosensitive ion channel family protein [Verrucomicrobiota bacterium JB022]|nr:mechanosensitive ion channel family protein [Verrucomicrobiota bacterium JB022]